MIFGYSLKRLLLGITVLWFLITLVFLLSKLLPGTYGSESILYTDIASYNKSTQQQRDQAYQAYLHKTGQDLPVFYFSVGNKAYQTNSFPALTAGILLEQLSWQYGDQQKVNTYYKELNNLIGLTRNESEHLLYLLRLQHALNPDSILSYTSALTVRLPQGEYHRAAINLHQAAEALVKSDNSLAYLIPFLQWHGVDNQYHRWLLLLLRGDLGESLKDARPVSTILWEAITNTFWLIGISMIITFFLSLELSMIMVRKTKYNWHKIALPFIYFLNSIPLFVLSLVLMILLATPNFLTLFPVFGLGYFTDQPETWHEHITQIIPYLVLPITSLVLANLPYLTNQMYRALADTMQANFIKTARSKGLKESVIIRRHALRNALLPVITVLSDFLPALVAGTVVIETIFAIPGIGRLLMTSVLARDFPVILGIVLLVALVKMLSHFVADICYAFADPRVQKATAT